MTEIKYDRQSRIPDWDQEKLKNAKVAVIGAGALGNHVCLGLIGLGIGTIKIYDYDDIEIHNLNRQSLFLEEDVGSNKAETLAKRLEERNSSLMIIGIEEKVDDDNIDEIILNVDLIIDCVDRIFVRRVLNRFCLINDIPMIHGGISWCGGQIGILTRKTPCINCIFPESLQKEELDVETSCTRKPEPSVVYINQIISGFMVEHVRRVLLPLPSDPELHKGLIKIDLRLNEIFYFEPMKRKESCECVSILKKVEPEILEKENSLKKKRNKIEKKEIEEALENVSLL